MPAVKLVYYREGDRVPVAEWLALLPPDAADVCVARLRLLKDGGHQLRRPLADVLAGGIHELRAKWRGINYRMLYFFFGRQVVVVSHGFTKQRSRVPDVELRTAMRRMERFKSNPFAHSSSAEV